MPWISTGLSVGGSLFGGAFGSSSKKKEASKMRKLMERAMDAQFLAQQEGKTAMRPYQETGTLANERLAVMLGLSSPEGYAPRPTREQIADELANNHYKKYGKNYTTKSNMGQVNAKIDRIYRERLAEWEKGLQEYEANNPNWQSQDPEFGSLLKEFTGDDLENDPGFQFRLSEGEKGINRNLAARGGWDSGAALKALARYNQDFASNEFGDAFNRDAATKGRIYSFLSGTSNAGQAAASTMASNAQGAANSMAGTSNAFGNSIAGLNAGAADDWSNGLQGAIGNAIYGYERNRTPANTGVVGNYGYSASRPFYY
jgi:hypothetical protein